MKTKMIILAVLVVLFTACSKKGNGGTFSEGYQMGVIMKLSEKGLMNKSGEAELYMGNASSRVVKIVDSTEVLVNPRLFSMDIEQMDSITKYEGEFVFMKYKQYRIGGYGRDTDYEPIFVKPIDKNLTIEPYETPVTGKFSKGSRIGRFVKASKKGNFNKSFEVIIQIGEEGSTFMEMSVTSQEMYDHILKYMESATLAKISYKQKFIRNVVNEDTDYEIWRIEPFKKPTL